MTTTANEMIPSELREMSKRWTVGRADNKHPVTLQGDDRTGKGWHNTDGDDFAEVEAKITRTGNKNLRLGFVLNDERDYTVIDLDKVRDPQTGEVVPWAQAIVDRFDAYTEVSASGEGLHVFLRGPKPDRFTSCEERGLPDYEGGETAGIEVYDHGRWILTTGDVYQGRVYLSDSDPLEEVFETLFADKAAPVSANGTPAPRPRGHWDSMRGGVAEGGRNNAMASLCGKLFSAGVLADDEILAALHARNEKNTPPMVATEVESVFRSIQRKHGAGGGGTMHGDEVAPVAADLSSHRSLLSQAPPWPTVMDDAALHGIVGEFVRLVEPETEADRAALVVQLLLAFGNAVGRSPFYSVNADDHRGNLFAVLVGPTSAGRKGTSWSIVRKLMQLVDEDWTKGRVLSGMSTGEGLIWAIRDAIRTRVPIKKDGRIEYQEVVSDVGIKDKRLLVMEGEFARVLKVAQRDGNTLSALVRLSWDGQKLQTMTKNSPATATDPHVSIVAHITKAELLRNLDSTEMVNGFCNRFLWICTKRSKLLPDGGIVADEDLAEIAKSLREVLASARKRSRVARDDDARKLWHEEYARLMADIPGMRGALLARGAPIVLRLSLIYALLDGCSDVGEDHVRAALAVWTYSEQSVAHIFGDATGDPVADRILSALREREKLTRTDIRDLFGKHGKAERIERALALLVSAGLARSEKESTGGKPREVWHCA